jgi:hypothetical protein
MSDAALRDKLDRMLVLLRTYNEPRWHAYFSEAAELLHAGCVDGAKKKIRGAYGGMGSFSDALYFTGAPKEIADEGYALRSALHTLSST